MQKVKIAGSFIGEEEPLAVVSGPCVIEGEEHCLRAAEALVEIFSGRAINFFFKSSYDKANRSSLNAFRGPGLQEGLRILERVRSEFGVSVVTDVHSSEEALVAGEVCDAVKVPAFLCRQTDLLVAAGKTGKTVFISKGPFMAPWDMKNAVEKVCSTGNENIVLVERGTSFGYNYLVSDMRAILLMQNIGYPVCFDAGHSVQCPGGLGTATGGQREFIPLLASAAVASGCNCLYIESHPQPPLAKCDASSVLDFKDFSSLLDRLEQIYQVGRVYGEKCRLN